MNQRVCAADTGVRIVSCFAHHMYLLFRHCGPSIQIDTQVVTMAVGIYNYSYELPFERDFDPVVSTVWMQTNWTLSITLSLFYVVAIYLGRL
jgi:hypothetical protein